MKFATIISNHKLQIEKDNLETTYYIQQAFDENTNPTLSASWEEIKAMSNGKVYRVKASVVFEEIIEDKI